MVRKLRAGVGLLVALGLVLPASSAAVAPSTLTGEGLFAGYGPSTGSMSTADCDPAGTSTIEYDIEGTAVAGPYLGTFKEHGLIVIGAQNLAPTGFIPHPFFPGYMPGTRGAQAGPVISATIEFEITSAAGSVSGTKSFDGATDAFGQCLVLDGDDAVPPDLGGGTGSGYFWGARGTLAYDAVIVNPSGTFADSGTSLLWFEECRISGTNSSVECGNFGEGFQSSNEPQGAATVTVTPPTATNPVGTSHSVLATATRTSGAAAAGATLLLSVSGSVNVSQSCVADVNGQCQFTYTGPALPGADLIVVCADNDGGGTATAGEPCGEATKAWLLPTSTPGQVTGGGHVLNPQDNEEVAFGFTAKSTANGLIGECTGVDKAPARNVKIKCLSVTTLVVSGTSATFFGQATVNGVTTSYRIDVTDVGEPGSHQDTFSIVLGTGYSAGGLLDSGNIQVHG